LWGVQIMKLLILPSPSSAQISYIPVHGGKIISCKR
jgi:hypothetical protein